MAIIDELNNLQTSIVTVKKVLADNIKAKGVSVSENDTLTSLSNAVKNIPQEGGGSSEGGNTFEVIGYTETPQYIQDNIDYSKTIYDNWDASITSCKDKYKGNTQLVYFPLVDTSNVTNMYQMFNGCSKLQYVPPINTSKVTNMRLMFKACTSLVSLDSSGWDTSKVTDMTQMFGDCGVTVLDLSGWDTSNVTDMSQMFSYCRTLTSLDLTGWDTSNVTSMSQMFYFCRTLTSLDLSGWDTSNVTSMSQMFSDCGSLTSLDLTGWDTSNVTSMSSMFSSCSGLTSLDLSGWDTSKVTSMSSIFSSCSGLTSLDLTGWDTSKVTSMSYFFNSCHNLQRIDGFIDWSKISSFPSQFIYSNSTYGGNPLRYMTIKNLGKTGTTFNFNNTSLQNWGDETDTTTYPLSVGARQTLVDSLLTYSYDRVANGLSTCTIQLHPNVKARLTEDEITAIQNKGYTIS